MALQIGIVLVVLVLALAVFISMRPASFRIERSAQIDAPDTVVFALINDFHHWSEWSPWDKLDPTMKKSFAGPQAGKGASYSWVVNSKAGEGRMTILDSQPSSLVSIELRFLKPMAATNQATFELTPAANGTNVRWTMRGESGFASKAFRLFVDMDKLVGKDFENGLANLNAVAVARGLTT